MPSRANKSIKEMKKDDLIDLKNSMQIKRQARPLVMANTQEKQTGDTVYYI